MKSAITRVIALVLFLSLVPLQGWTTQAGVGIIRPGRDTSSLIGFQAFSPASHFVRPFQTRTAAYVYAAAGAALAVIAIRRGWIYDSFSFPLLLGTLFLPEDKTLRFAQEHRLPYPATQRELRAWWKTVRPQAARLYGRTVTLKELLSAILGGSRRFWPMPWQLAFQNGQRWERDMNKRDARDAMASARERLRQNQTHPLRWQRHPDMEALSQAAADDVAQVLRDKADAVLLLPTGDTPKRMYAILAERAARGEVDFSHARIFMLDEVYGTSDFKDFIQSHLIQHLPEHQRPQVHVLDGYAMNLQKEGERYERLIALAGGIDLAVLGIGEEGHLAYNLPGSDPESTTRLIRFPNAPEPYTHALTVGLLNILSAKKIVLLATGDKKKAPLDHLRDGMRDPQWPVTVLHSHPDVTIRADEPAAPSWTPTITAALLLLFLFGAPFPASAQTLIGAGDLPIYHPFVYAAGLYFLLISGVSGLVLCVLYWSSYKRWVAGDLSGHTGMVAAKQLRWIPILTGVLGAALSGYGYMPVILFGLPFAAVVSDPWSHSSADPIDEVRRYLARILPRPAHGLHDHGASIGHTMGVALRHDGSRLPGVHTPRTPFLAVATALGLVGLSGPYSIPEPSVMMQQSWDYMVSSLVHVVMSSIQLYLPETLAALTVGFFISLLRAGVRWLKKSFTQRYLRGHLPLSRAA